MSSHQVISIYTQLKNADLACMSAKDTIQSILKFEGLRHLHRYTRWDIHYTETKDIETHIKNILENSYYIANPNKEHYFLNDPPKKPHADHTCIYHLSVFEQSHSDDIYTKEKIMNHFSIQLDKIEKSIVWELVLEQNLLPKEPEAYLKETLILSTSHTKGLLVNPLYETFTLEKVQINEH